MARRIIVALGVSVVLVLAGCSGNYVMAPEMENTDGVQFEEGAGLEPDAAQSGVEFPGGAEAAPDTTIRKAPPIHLSWGELKAMYWSPGSDVPPKGDDW
jgi:hypothetical protein